MFSMKHNAERAVHGNCYCDECSAAYNQGVKKLRENIKSGAIKIEYVPNGKK